MFVATEGTGSSSTNCFDKSRRQYVVKTPGFSVTGARTTRCTWEVGEQAGRKEGRNSRRSLQEEGTRATEEEDDEEDSRSLD